MNFCEKLTTKKLSSFYPGNSDAIIIYSFLKWHLVKEDQCSLPLYTVVIGSQVVKSVEIMIFVMNMKARDHSQNMQLRTFL